MCFAASATCPAEASMPSTSNPKLPHSSHVPALAAAGVEAAPPAGKMALDDVAHQARLRPEQRVPPRLGDLHVVGVGDLVEVLCRRARWRAQVDEEKHAAERRRHAHRGQPDAEGRERRRCAAEAGGLQLVEQARAGDEDASRREHQAAEARRSGVGVFRGDQRDRPPPTGRHDPEPEPRQDSTPPRLDDDPGQPRSSVRQTSCV